jgi:hypothetical protein
MRTALQFICTGLLLVWTKHAEACDPGGRSFWLAWEVGHRHSDLHNIAHGLLVAAAPLAVLGWMVLRVHRKSMNARARSGECLKMKKWWHRITPVAAYAFMLVPVAAYMLFSWVLDGSLAWDCSLYAQVDHARSRAAWVAACTAIGGGLGVFRLLWVIRGKGMFRSPYRCAVLWPPLILGSMFGIYLLARVYWWITLWA